MDEIAHSIVQSFHRIVPLLLRDPVEFCRRRDRGVAALAHPPRPWCLAIRACDTRLASIATIESADIDPAPFPHSRSFDASYHPQTVSVGLAAIDRLCSHVHLDSNQTIDRVTSSLGTSRAGLLNSRIKGRFRTHHVEGLGGRWGRPRPLLSSDAPLDPSARGFPAPDPLWSWTSNDLVSRLPRDLPPQHLLRVPVFAPRGSHRDTADLHPEHPLLDPIPSKRRTKLPPPEPDPVWYKWKDGQFLGYDWRNPLAKENHERHQRQLERSRAAQKRRRAERPKNGPTSGSLQFRGWRWQCPKCHKLVNVLFLPVKPVNILTEEIASVGLPMVAAISDPKSKISNFKSPIANRKSAIANAFACSSCHRIRRFSHTRADVWNEIVCYLTAGLLYGREVPKPSWFKTQRKMVPHIKPMRQVSKRRPQIESLMLKGLSIAQIAKRLRLAKGTILFYSTQIYQQHGVKSLRELYLKYEIPIRPGMRGPAKGKRGEGRVPRPRRPHRVTMLEKVCARVLEGASPERIIQELQHPRRRVLDMLRKLRRKNLIPEIARVRRSPISSSVKREIQKRIARGERMLKIARELGVGTSTVYWVRSHMNDAVRPHI